MKKTLFLSSAAIAVMSVGAHAAIAIQLTGAAWATANGNLGNAGSVMNATNIQPGAGYNGAALRGGAVATNSTIALWQVQDNGGLSVLNAKDVFLLQGTTSGTDTKFHRAVLFFDQSVFSNGLSTVSGGVTLNNTTSLSYTAKRNLAACRTFKLLRFWVKCQFAGVCS